MGVEFLKLCKNKIMYLKRNERKKLRQPGIEPGSTAWKAAMLTIIPLTPCYKTCSKLKKY